MTNSSVLRRRILKKNERAAIAECTPAHVCEACRADQLFLRQTQKPIPPVTKSFIRSVDLFAGCGGMSLGLAEAARRCGMFLEVALAVDNDPDAIAIYERNLEALRIELDGVESLFDGNLGEPITDVEQSLKDSLGRVDILIGGPPCQGHSDLNNHTRRRDPKNALYLRMARAAEVLQPDLVVIENVSSVQWDEGNVVAATKAALVSSGFAVEGKVLDLSRLGVPQRRRRFVLVASRITQVRPRDVLSVLSNPMGAHKDRTVRWAISDLMDVRSESVFDSASKPKEENRKRMQYLFEHGVFNLPNDQRPECHQDGEHSYNSVYGRLRWDHPAQTITTGFGCMGQGRYVHPQRRRTITPHEAARLQTFPDWFDFGSGTKRGILAKTIGNAVPPLMMMCLGEAVLPLLALHRL